MEVADRLELLRTRCALAGWCLWVTTEIRSPADMEAPDLVSTGG